MGLKETIRGAAQTAIAAVGNIGIPSTYLVKGSPSYSPNTGQVSTDDTAYTGVPVIFDDNAYLSLGNIDVPNLTLNQNERLFYVAQLDLAPTPKVGDELVVQNVTWQIMDIKTDPAEALWIFKGKKP